MKGGARRRRAKKGYKGQKGGAVQAVPNDLTSLKFYIGKGTINNVNNSMFKSDSSGPNPILTTLEQGSDYNLFGFRPMVRPEVLNTTLGSVLAQVRSSSMAKENTLGGISDQVVVNLNSAYSNDFPAVACYDMKGYAMGGPGTVRNGPGASGRYVRGGAAAVDMNLAHVAGGIQNPLIFKTIGEFAEHLQGRLSELNNVLVQAWKVHETYTKNINKVEVVSKGGNGVRNVKRLWENMNAAVGIAYVYENPKPLNRIEEHLKELSADKLSTFIDARGQYDPIQPNVGADTATGRLWYKADNKDSKDNVVTAANDDTTV